LKEVSGSLGDLGTFFPLIVGMVSAGSASASGALIWFGLFSILTGLTFGIPLAVQPMKAIASYSIAHRLPPEALAAAGLVTGAAVLLASQTRILKVLHEHLSRTVIIGLQVTLGLQLSYTALTMMMQRPLLGPDSLAVGVLSLMVIILSLRFKAFPAALFLTFAGVAIALALNPQILLGAKLEFHLPHLVAPSAGNMVEVLEMAVAQVPLTVTNSLLATVAVARRYFPQRPPAIQSVALNLSAINLSAPLLGGIPMCYGAGGITSWYKFGARTAASMLFFGTTLMALGLFFGSLAIALMAAFPLTVLAAMLLFIGFQLTLMVRESPKPRDLLVVTVTVAVAILSNMFLGLAAGFICSTILKRTTLSRCAQGAG